MNAFDNVSSVVDPTAGIVAPVAASPFDAVSDLHDAPSASAQPNAQPAGILQGIGMGLMDPVNGLAQLGLHAAQYLPDSLQPYGLKGADKQIDAQIASDNSDYEAGRQAAGRDGFDWARLTGQFLSSAPALEALPEIGATRLAQAGEGAIGGAVNGALQPDTSGGHDFWNDKAVQSTAGAGVGAALSPILGAAAGAISPKISPEAQTLLDNGVTPTPGQLLGGGWNTAEDKATSIPVLGRVIQAAQARSLDQFNTAALNRAVEPIGGSVSAIGRDGVQQVKDQLSGAYNDLLPNLTFKADPQFMGDISNLSSMANNLPDQQAKTFADILQRQVYDKLGPQGTMDGLSYKGAESELNNAAKGYKSDPSYDNRQLGQALGQAVSNFRAGLSRSNPDAADQLANINQGYANYAIVRNAASKLGQTDPGKFTPAQLAQAVRASDNSAGKGNYATGNALMQDLSDAGRNVLSQKYPDSGTAGREAFHILLGTALEGGSAAMGHAVLPVVAGAVAAAPYTSTGQKLAAALLASRPAAAEPLANALAKSTKYVAGGVTPIALPFAQAAYQ